MSSCRLYLISHYFRATWWVLGWRRAIVSAFNTRSKTVRRGNEHQAELSDLHATAYGENVHLDRRSELGSVAAKLHHGVSEQSGLQTSEANRRVGSPVDRDSKQRPEEPERFGGAAWVEVARTERRTPTPDRHQREI